MAYPYSRPELNAKALEHFIYQPVNKPMISFLADAAFNVIVCDATIKPNSIKPSKASSSSAQSNPQRVQSDDGGLPTLHEFITQLVCSSNVQVPTLMSTLVYLTRLRSRLQPMARGLRCTTHRIFLAALILAAKYLNDMSPKNKYWASYSNIVTDLYSFGFSRTEVNLMEKQLLYLLDWDLRIRDEDLYRELDSFLEPIRYDIELKQARRIQRRRVAHEEQLRQLDTRSHQQPAIYQQPLRLEIYPSISPPVAPVEILAVSYRSPPPTSHNNDSYASSNLSASSESTYSSVPSLSNSTPPSLAFSGRGSPESMSRLMTPESYTASAPADACVVDSTATQLPSPVDAAVAEVDDLQEIQEDAGKQHNKHRMSRNVLGRVFGTVSVR